MKKTAATISTTSVPKVANTQQTSAPKLHVGREIVDTTWRMAVPVVLFAFLGIFADIKLDTKPWFTLLGVIIGFAFAVVLIKQQIARSGDSA